MGELSRNDRRVYAAVVALALLAAVPPLVGSVARTITDYHEPPPPPPPPHEVVRPPAPAVEEPPPRARSAFERHGPYAFLGAAVTLALAWEYVKWLRRTYERLVREEPLPVGPAVAFAVCVALPLGVPFALGTTWASSRMMDVRTGPFAPRPLVTGAVTFAVALGLFAMAAWAWVAAARAAPPAEGGPR